MISRAVVIPLPECDLIAKGTSGGEHRGWLMHTDGSFVSDRVAEAPYTLAELLDIVKTTGQAMNFTCTPPGSGVRMGIDRDEDGVLDGDEAAPVAVLEK
jgi:hypothetical protein